MALYAMALYVFKYNNINPSILFFFSYFDYFKFVAF